MVDLRAIAEELVRVLADGTIEPGIPLMEVAVRGTDLRPVWDVWKSAMFDPGAYEDPQVIRGGGQLGCIRVDPGYLVKGKTWVGVGKTKPHLSAGRTKGTMTVRSTRVLQTEISDATIDALASAVGEYMLTGRVVGPRGGGAGG